MFGWFDVALYFGFVALIGVERYLARGLAPRTGWLGSEGGRILVIAGFLPALRMAGEGISTWHDAGDQVGFIVATVALLLLVGACGYIGETLIVTVRARRALRDGPA